MINKLTIIDNPNASKDKKRLLATFELNDGKTKKIKFGFWKSGGTFYDINDNKKRLAYIARHSKMNEDWNNIVSAGALSRWVLWEFNNISDIKKFLKNKFNINKIEINITKYRFNSK
jgi:hypothetical protein